MSRPIDPTSRPPPFGFPPLRLKTLVLVHRRPPGVSVRVRRVRPWGAAPCPHPPGLPQEDRAHVHRRSRPNCTVSMAAVKDAATQGDFCRMERVRRGSGSGFRSNGSHRTAVGAACFGRTDRDASAARRSGPCQRSGSSSGISASLVGTRLDGGIAPRRFTPTRAIWTLPHASGPGCRAAVANAGYPFGVDHRTRRQGA